jgi:hypothetical protein
VQYFIARFQRTGADGRGTDVATPSATPSAVPEPTTLVLAALGALGIFSRRINANPR